MDTDKKEVEKIRTRRENILPGFFIASGGQPFQVACVLSLPDASFLRSR
jgi:hypothetical protein